MINVQKKKRKKKKGEGLFWQGLGEEEEEAKILCYKS